VTVPDETTESFEVTRRGALAATAGALGTSGCTEILSGDRSTPTQTSTPTSTPEPLAKTSVQENALEHAREHYYVDKSGRDLGEDYNVDRMVERMEDFLGNEDYPEQFKDKQLGYWLDLPGNLDDPGTTVVSDGETDWEALGRDLKHFVLRNRLLGADDWTKTGQPQILPDGSEGEGHHYNHTEEPNWDPDAFMPRWYNETGSVFDIPESGKAPDEWVYKGPDPVQGDRVGKLGENPEYAGQENQANFSIANHLEEPEPEDLVGNPVTVCRVDWTAQGPEDYSPEPSTETLEIAEDVLRDVGFQPYMFKGKELEYNEVQRSEDLPSVWKQHMPTELKGPVEYAVIDHGAGGAFDTTEASLGVVGANTTQKKLAHTLLHECYGHPFLGGHADKDRETIMTPTVHPDPIMQYTEEGEETLRRGIDIRSHSRRASDAIYTKFTPGFYSGPLAVYKDSDYYSDVRDLY
jgi:hypothetical protein